MNQRLPQKKEKQHFKEVTLFIAVSQSLETKRQNHRPWENPMSNHLERSLRVSFSRTTPPHSEVLMSFDQDMQMKDRMG